MALRAHASLAGCRISDSRWRTQVAAAARLMAADGYKNDERLGVMVSSGLGGECCWGAELYTPGDSARIDAAAAPASPTAEELARTWTRGLDSASDSGDD